LDEIWKNCHHWSFWIFILGNLHNYKCLKI
jgi:hypothetical protein